MPIGILYWGLLIAWVILGYFFPGVWVNIILVILLAIVGWKLFGPVVQG